MSKKHNNRRRQRRDVLEGRRQVNFAFEEDCAECQHLALCKKRDFAKEKEYRDKIFERMVVWFTHSDHVTGCPLK